LKHRNFDMPAQVFVLIPTFNVEPFIATAIESVIQQTFQDWELLVLDDCSTDNTFAIAQSYANKDSRIEVIRNTENLGMLGNWNKGITYCTSPFFIKLDGDDYWHSEMLSKAWQVLKQNPEVALVFSKYVNVNMEGAVVEGSAIELPEFARGKAFSCVDLVQQGSEKMLSYSVLRQGLSIFRTEVFKELGPYRFLLTPDTQASTDTEFYFRVGCHHKIFCLDEVQYFYRVHNQSISSINKQQDLGEQKMFEVKTVINDYYFQQGKIDRSVWKQNKANIEFLYHLYQAYRFRKQGNWLRSAKQLLNETFMHPNLMAAHVWKRFKIL
jgi:glycosyltransferase involved in cell wall biosynthesis